MSKDLGDSKQIHALAFDLAPTGLLAIDPSGTILLANRAIEEAFGYTHEELIGNKVELLVPERFREKHPTQLTAFFSAPQARAMGAGRDLFALRKDGSEFPVEIGLAPAKTKSGMIVLASVVDISPRKRAEERFHAAVESSPSGMIMIDASGMIVLINRETERLFDYTRDELIGEPMEILVPKRYRDRHPSHRQAFFNDLQARPMGSGRELHGLRKDGTEIAVEIGLNPIRMGNATYVLSSIVDVSARLKVDHDLKESEARLRALLEGIHDYAIAMLNSSGELISWNAGAESLTGWTAAEVLGHSFSLLFSEEGRQGNLPQTLLRIANDDGRFEGEAALVRKDTRAFLANVLLTPLRQSIDLSGFVLIIRDVTLRRELDARVRQSQKLEAIGTLATGIAHDFNNILANVVGYGELVRDAVKGETQTTEDIERVLKAGDRGRRLVQRILSFSRRNEAEAKAMRLDQALPEVLELLRASLPSSIEIKSEIDPNTPIVSADDMLLHQVVTNLATNAAHSMAEGGGKLTISLTRLEVQEQGPDFLSALAPGNYAHLRVSDTGTGMSQETLDRVLEPFFTTKGVGAGTGLGLWVILGLVEGCRGRLSLRSKLGEGTTVDVVLPAADLEETNCVVTPAATENELSKHHVFVVEDEVHIAELLRRQLESQGHRVTVHTSSVRALDDFGSRAHAFDLVISDNTMPQMSGLEMAGRMKQIRKDIKILMVSGIGDSVDRKTLAAKGVDDLLPKPYSSTELAAIVKKILSST